ncbi:sensor histidine kinase [Comamonadaceae bacterium PP-2]
MAGIGKRNARVCLHSGGLDLAGGWRAKLGIALLLWLYGLAWPAQARPDSIPAFQLYRLIDPVADWTAAQRAVEAGQTVPIPPEWAAGYGPSLWLVMDVAPQSADAPLLWVKISPAYLNSVTAYIPVANGVQALQAGSMAPRNPQDLSNRFAIFALPPAHGAGQRIYFRIETETPRSFFVRLETHEMLLGGLASENLAMGLFFGGLAFTLVWALFYGFWLRNRFYFVYATYIAVLSVTAACVTGLATFWMPEGWFNIVLTLGMVLLLPLGAETLGILQPGRDFPHMCAACRGALWLLALLQMGRLLCSGHESAAIEAGMAYPLQLAVAVLLCLALGRASRGAAAWLAVLYGCELVFALLALLHSLGYLSSNWLTRNLYIVFAYLHVVLFNLAAIVRIHALQRERAEVRQAWADRFVDSERRLEQCVEARTADLLQEIRQRQATEESLKRDNLDVINALAAARQAQESQRQFFMMVSHDFRTPLGVLDATLEYGDLTARTVRQRMRRALDDLLALVDKALSPAMMAEAAPAGQCAVVDVVAALRKVIRRSAYLARDHRVHVSASLHRLFVWANGQAIEMLLSNLLNNAIVHTPSGSSITLAARREGDEIVLTVEDDGPGVSAEEIGQLFCKYGRGSQASCAGTGLGLYLVARIAALYGGHATAVNLPEAGLRVMVRLPAWNAPQAAGMPSLQPGPVDGSSWA